MGKPKTIRCLDCGKAIKTHPYDTTMEELTYSVCGKCVGPELTPESLFLTPETMLPFAMAVKSGLINASR